MPFIRDWFNISWMNDLKRDFSSTLLRRIWLDCSTFLLLLLIEQCVSCQIQTNPIHIYTVYAARFGTRVNQLKFCTHINRAIFMFSPLLCLPSRIHLFFFCWRKFSSFLAGSSDWGKNGCVYGKSKMVVCYDVECRRYIAIEKLPIEPSIVHQKKSTHTRTHTCKPRRENLFFTSIERFSLPTRNSACLLQLNSILPNQNV